MDRSVLKLTTMIFLVELKRNGITRRSVEVVGLKLQLPIKTYHYFVVGTITRFC